MYKKKLIIIGPFNSDVYVVLAIADYSSIILFCVFEI